MANPHPTKSKPCKIGRKHTGALGVRAKGRRKSDALRKAKTKEIARREYKDRIALYWAGELDTYPQPNRILRTINP